MDSVFFYLEILGVIAFSISGALVALNKKFDVFGVVIVGMITAVGGGVVRDIIIGKFPPTIFSNVYLIIISVVASLCAFILAYIKRDKFLIIQSKIETVNNYFDAVGLAVFTIMGVESVFTRGLSSNILLSISMGVLTGVGGGVMRDVLTGSSPYIFTKHIYAIASISGACVFYALRIYVFYSIVGTIVGTVLIFVLRILATKYLWKLPKAHIDEK